jgi:glycosyltransferase involved in cell wall biosynthesis
MIVKNESHIIETTLQNILDNIPLTSYVISDTGSTDNTIEIIKKFFNKNNIKGKIYNDEWQDFGYNRSLALKHAFNKSDYVFIFDADDRFNGIFKMPEQLNYDTYYFKFGGGCQYKRHLLINNRIEWKYVGVLHEYLTTVIKDYKFSCCYIEGEYYINSGKIGDRSKDPDKYRKDALILEKAHNKAVEENDHIKVRYSFYCAQSYRDCNEKEKSIEWYKKRVEYGDWNQEVYFSLFQIGLQYMELKEYEKAIYYWSLSIGVDDRYECLYEIISHFRKNKKPLLAYQYYKMIDKFDINKSDKLFLPNLVYDYLLDFEIINFVYYYYLNILFWVC